MSCSLSSRPMSDAALRRAWRTTRFASCCALFALSVACGERRAAPPDPKSAAITDSLKGPGEREGTWTGADAQSTWTATLDGPRITQMNERAIYSDSTRAERQFQFDSTGALSFVRETRVQILYGAKATPDTVRALIELEWITDSLVRSAKRVNDAERLLQPYEVDNLRTHADELLRIARVGASLRPSGK